jgi:GNAT superfamily N-acetyltransferase
MSSAASDLTIEPACADDVRAIQRRRNCDEAAVRLSLAFAQEQTVWIGRDGGDVVAIAVAHDSLDERYVGDLFVESSYRGGGVGGRLLQAAFESADERARLLLIDGTDPAGIALAYRCGLSPREPLLRYAGAIPREEDLAKMAAGEYRFEVAAIDPEAQALALAELDRQSRGTSRVADHLRFTQSASGNVFFRGGECVGYAYVWPDGRIGPIACASESYLIQIFAYTMVTLRRSFGASWCSALVPGSNRRIARAALRAGLRICDAFLLAGDAAFANTSTYVGCHQLLL